MTHKKILLLLLCCFMIQFLQSQDIHFTQFYNAPLTLNPALAGDLEKNHRINLNYRNQYSEVLRGDAYNAYNLSYDKKVSLKNGNALGMGFSSFADRAGELNFGTNQGHLSIAYHKRLGSDTLAKHILSFAVEYGIVERKVDLTNARWPSQHDGNGGFCPTCPEPQGPSFNPDFLHSDINIGLNWSSKISSSFSFAIGTAIRHLNQPNISFYGDQSNEKLSQRFTAHAQANWKLGTVTSLSPRFLYNQQGAYKESTLGMLLDFELGKPSLSVGHYLRMSNEIVGGINSDAFITVFSMDFNVFRFGISFDVPLSNDTRGGGNNGAAELTTAVRF